MTNGFSGDKNITGLLNLNKVSDWSNQEVLQLKRRQYVQARKEVDVVKLQGDAEEVT